MPSLPGRYLTLDAFRGIAALAVVVFHCSNTIVNRDSLSGQVLLLGWVGLFVLFPISGYCILAALDSPGNRTAGKFLARRCRRIMPPYWASIAVTVAVAVAALPFNRGTAGDLLLSPLEWASVLTLTQVFMPQPSAINPVYWSLCYELQFYLVMALMLLAPARRRAPLLAALTAAAAVYVSPAWPWRVTGVFLDYWMCFSVGCATHLWLHDRSARKWAAGILAIATLVGVASASLALLVSVATAIALVVLAPHDRALAGTRFVSLLMAVGAFSFSVYLVHVPLGGRVTNLLDRFGLPPALTIAAAVAVSLGAGWLFYLAVERRPFNERRDPEDGMVPAVAA